MRRLGLVLAGAVLAMASALAGTCTNTNLYQIDSVHGLGGSFSCTLGGFTFSNFILQQYTDFNFPAGVNYYNFDPTSSNNPNAFQNAAPNYLVSFTLLNGTSPELIFSPAIPAGAPGWSLTTNSLGDYAKLAFEIKYTVTGGFNNLVDSINNVQYTDSPSLIQGQNAVAAFVNNNQIQTVNAMVTNSNGTASSTLFPLNAPNSTQITNDFLLQVQDHAGTVASADSFTNLFNADAADVTPEPATFALFGGALAGLGLLRRRSRRS